MSPPYSDLLQSGIGAVIGFALAQAVNLAKLGRDWLVAPRLEIDGGDNDYVVLDHSDYLEPGHSAELVKEKLYGFYVRNTGRRIATGVRFQLLKIECREIGTDEFRTVAEHGFELVLYLPAHHRIPAHHRDFKLRPPSVAQTSLVPKATALVDLATWRANWPDIVKPSVSAMPEYYEPICSSSDAYRFTVVAFDDGGRYAQKVVTIKTGYRETA
jgi:hypothetical protein